MYSRFSQLRLHATDDDSQEKFEKNPIFHPATLDAATTESSNHNSNDSMDTKISPSDCNKVITKRKRSRKKKYRFKIVLTPKIRFAVLFDLDKTVDELLCEIRIRWEKRCKCETTNYKNSDACDLNTTNTMEKIDTISKTNKSKNNTSMEQMGGDLESRLLNLKPEPSAIKTLYFVDYGTLPKSPIFVVLRGCDILRDIVQSYQQRGKFYWLAVQSITGILFVLCIM